MNQQNPVASALMAKMNIASEDRSRVKLECLPQLATLHLAPARMKLIPGFIDTYLRLNVEEERLFQAEVNTIEPSEQEVVMEIVTSWMERGIEQGIEQGKHQGEVALIMRQLNRRFGGVAPEVEARIRSLSIEQLENLGEALLDFSDVSDLSAWLEQKGI